MKNPRPLWFWISVGVAALFVLAVAIAVIILRQSQLDYNRAVTLSPAVASLTPSFSALASASPSPTPSPSVLPSEVATSTPTATPVPDRVNHNVPFTAQAPTANWDAVHEETCEEASLLMAQWWQLGKTGEQKDGYSNRIPQSVAEAAMMEQVAWQRETFGYFEDTDAAETIRLAKEKLGMTNITLKTDVTTESLKAELARGNILLIPAAGQLLQNPYFKAPGPPYHMFVVRGYNEKGFIANDPGTRRGEAFVYPYANLVYAVHDWTGSDATMTTGAKVVIVVGK